VTASAWRIVAAIVSIAVFMACRPVSCGQSAAAGPADAGTARADAATTAPVAPPADVPPTVARPAKRLSPAACGRLKQRVERELAAAQRCEADTDCASITLEYAFRPCGESVNAGASLEKATADGRAYVDGCQPVLRPVKCAHMVTPVCTHRRCALAPPPGE